MFPQDSIIEALERFKWKLDEVIITRAIFEEYSKTFLDYIDNDVALVGVGPANLAVAKYLAKAGSEAHYLRAEVIYWGQHVGWRYDVSPHGCTGRGRRILENFGIRHRKYQPGYYVANSVESVGKLIAVATSAGTEVFEDVMTREKKLQNLPLIDLKN